jgi:Sec-independent protein secretion pathway component TatC
MDIFIILGVFWVAFVGYTMIKKDGKRGVVVLAFIIGVAMLWASGDKFGFSGGMMAVIFSILFLIGVYIYDNVLKKNR